MNPGHLCLPIFQPGPDTPGHVAEFGRAGDRERDDPGSQPHVTQSSPPRPLPSSEEPVTQKATRSCSPGQVCPRVAGGKLSEEVWTSPPSSRLSDSDAGLALPRACSDLTCPGAPCPAAVSGQRQLCSSPRVTLESGVCSFDDDAHSSSVSPVELLEILWDKGLPINSSRRTAM